MGIFTKSHKVFDRELVVSRLAKLFDELENVRLAILFGSLAKGGAAIHDIDIAIRFAGESNLLDLGQVVIKIAEALGVSEDIIDIVDLDHAYPILLMRVIKEGMIIKGDEKELKRLAERASLYPDALIELREWSTLDPNPRLDKAILSSRIEEIRRNVHFLKENILNRDVNELKYGDILILERATHRIIEAMLDVCRHLTSVYSLGLVESYGEYALKLAKDGKMPSDLANNVSRLTGLRNILVHRYLEVETSKLYDTAKEIADRIAVKFIEWIQSISS